MSVSFSCNRHFHQRALQLQQPLPELTLHSEMSSELCVVYFVAHSLDDSDSLLDFLFAQEFYYGVCGGGGTGQDRGMVSVITTEWHLWVIKRSGSASKELTLPALTFTKVEIKAPLQKIYGNSNVQSAAVFVRCLALTHAHSRASHSCVGCVTSRWRPSAKCNLWRSSQ